MAANGQGRSGFLAAGLGGALGGALVYLLMPGFGEGVDLEDRLTFDQSGELELEGLAIIFGLALASAVGVTLGAYLALKIVGASQAGVTALLSILATPGLTLLAGWAVPSGPNDPVIAPYVVLGVWFLSPSLARLALEGWRGNRRSPGL
jgi:hypothetical protein